MEADNKGLYNNEGICDRGIVICNETVKALASGQYIAFCDNIHQIAQIFANLKTAVKADRESIEQKIEDLKRQNAALQEQIEQKGKV